MEDKIVYLFCLPLNIIRKIKTLSGMKCFFLIWLKCCFSHSFFDIAITKKDQERIHLSRKSYARGLTDLEKVGLISVVRKTGRANRISVKLELLDQKSKTFVLKGRLI